MPSFKSIFALLICLTSFACSSAPQYSRTVEKVDIQQFMKKWYVIAGRFTFMEKGAHNAVEDYSYNKDKERIEIDFYFNKDSFDGKIKRIPQKGWIQNKETNAYWKVSPFWPLKFDYLVIALADDYSWTAIGVPSQKYLWIMADDWYMNDEKLAEVTKVIEEKGYSVENIVRIPQKWD